MTYAPGSMSDLPPPSTDRVEGIDPPKRDWWTRIPQWGWIVGVVLVIAIAAVATLSNSDSDDDQNDDGGGIEMCAFLADRDNADFTKGDIRRLADWSNLEIEDYINDHCPAQLSRWRAR